MAPVAQSTTSESSNGDIESGNSSRKRFKVNKDMPDVPHSKPRQKIAKEIIEVVEVTPPLEFPCALCPDMSHDALVPIVGTNLKAHRLCVMFTRASSFLVSTILTTFTYSFAAETYIDKEKGKKEVVRGFERIDKMRWKLKCGLCSEMYGSKSTFSLTAQTV